MPWKWKSRPMHVLCIQSFQSMIFWGFAQSTFKSGRCWCFTIDEASWFLERSKATSSIHPFWATHASFIWLIGVQAGRLRRVQSMRPILNRFTSQPKNAETLCSDSKLWRCSCPGFWMEAVHVHSASAVEKSMGTISSISFCHDGTMSNVFDWTQILRGIWLVPVSWVLRHQVAQKMVTLAMQTHLWWHLYMTWRLPNTCTIMLHLPNAIETFSRAVCVGLDYLDWQGGSGCRKLCRLHIPQLKMGRMRHHPQDLWRPAASPRFSNGWPPLLPGKRRARN